MKFDLVTKLGNGRLETTSVELVSDDPDIQKLEKLAQDENVAKAIPLAFKALRSIDKQIGPKKRNRLLWIMGPLRHAA